MPLVKKEYDSKKGEKVVSALKNKRKGLKDHMVEMMKQNRLKRK